MKFMTSLWLVAFLLLAGCADPYAADKPVEKKRENIIGRTTQDIGEFKQDDAEFTVKSDEITGMSPLNPLSPMKAYGPTVQKISKMHIQQALNLFRAEFDRYPADHEEFMTKIIKQNNIELPVLPGDSVYQYDVANHELVVVTPTQEPARKNN
jgi:hypothetical protein